MLAYMLDTSICIEVIKSHPPSLKGRFNRLADQICISSITLAELMFGAEKSLRRSENLEAAVAFARNTEVLPFSAKAAAAYGALRAAVERQGRPGGYHDVLIAAHAISEGLTLVSNDARGFAHLPGLRSETWA